MPAGLVISGMKKEISDGCVIMVIADFPNTEQAKNEEGRNMANHLSHSMFWKCY